MKVSGAARRKTENAAQSAGGAKGSWGSASGVVPAQETFAEIAEDVEARRILDELDALGAQLSRYPAGMLLARYRELVMMALDRVRRNMQTRREYKWKRTERAMYIIIERVEGALDEMDEALNREGERTRLLSLIDEIKGCLISLLF